MRKKNILGQQFGKLTVIKEETSYKGRGRWLCRCSCGTEKVVTTKHLTGGLVKTCAAPVHYRGEESNSWKGYKQISGKYWASILRNAKSRNLLVNISINELHNLILKQNSKCALTGKPLFKFDGTDGSLDRIDSSKGYTIDNIQWVHKYINLMKLDLPQTDFIELCRLVTINNKV